MADGIFTSKIRYGLQMMGKVRLQDSDPLVILPLVGQPQPNPLHSQYSWQQVNTTTYLNHNYRAFSFSSIILLLIV